MRIEIDGVIAEMQPDSVNWQPPSIVGRTGEGAPVLAPTWRCGLGFSQLTRLLYWRWLEVWDGASHLISLPHPKTGKEVTYSCYVDSVTPRLNTADPCIAAASGVDVALSSIDVDWLP